MCLIFTDLPSNAALSDAWLSDFYSHNSDGWGFLYACGGTLFRPKALGSEAEWIKDYRMVRALGLPFICHLRMETHGGISLENTHPYPITDDVWMMHNGVLARGYAGGDKSRSDTWHYIHDILTPLVKEYGEKVLFSPSITQLLGEAIGNNRFALMNRLGETVIINQDQGVMWHGRWMSNEYAWDSMSDKALPTEGPIDYGYSRIHKSSWWAGSGKKPRNSYYDAYDLADEPPVGSIAARDALKAAEEDLDECTDAIFTALEKHGRTACYDLDQGEVEEYVAEVGAEGVVTFLDDIEGGHLSDKDILDRVYDVVYGKTEVDYAAG